MQECGRNVEVMYLLGKLCSDFRTISDYRKSNAKALRNVFKAFVKLCLKLKLYERELLAVDGTKFRAVNSKDNAYNAEKLHKKLPLLLIQLDKATQPDPVEPFACTVIFLAGVTERIMCQIGGYGGKGRESPGLGGTRRF